MSDLIDRCCGLAYKLAHEIGALDGAELVVSPTFNQGVVRFLSQSHNAMEKDHDRETEKMIAAINAQGTAFFSGTAWKGRHVMRISVINWRTTEADVRATVTSVKDVLASRSASSD